MYYFHIKTIDIQLTYPMHSSMLTVCSKFVAQESKTNTCRNCSGKKEDHAHDLSTVSSDCRVANNTRISSGTLEATYSTSSNDTKATDNLSLAVDQDGKLKNH